MTKLPCRTLHGFNCLIVKSVLVIIMLTAIFHIIFRVSHKILNSGRILEDSRSVEMMRRELLSHFFVNKCRESTGHNSTLSLDERNIIFIIGDDDMNTTFVTFLHNFLLFHPQVIYLGSLAVLYFRIGYQMTSFISVMFLLTNCRYVITMCCQFSYVMLIIF